MCRLNPKVDFAFKKLFASLENKDILISFINSVLSENEQIKDIELKNPYNIANYRKGKMTILDIKAVDEAVKKAIEKLDIMYLDSEEREIYENDLKRLRIHKAELKTAERKGREEGIDIGEDRKALKVAEKMIKRGDSVEDIVEITELPRQKVLELKNKLG